MLLPYGQLIKKYNIQPKGVLHVGANNGFEAKTYYNNGVEQTIWIEPIKEVFEELWQNVQKYPNVIVLNELIDEEEKEVDFHISDNNGESSSMFEFGEHKEMHSNVHFKETIKLKTKRLDTLLKSTDGYEFINLDTQGAELSCLKSLGYLLNKINYVYCEVNKTEVYKGIPLFDELVQWLDEKGFDLKETGQWIKNTKGQDAWTDAFFIRRTF